jgi:LysR family glycine cleavage system transcriptional activator
VAEARRLLEQAVGELDAERSAKTLVVSTLGSFASRWLALRLPRFAEVAPGRSDRCPRRRPSSESHDRRVDVCIRYGAGPVAGLSAVELMREVFFPVCSPEFLSRIHCRRCRRWRAPPDPPPQQPVADVVRSVGLEYQERPAGRCSTTRRGAGRGRERLGVALARSSLSEHDLKTGRLVKPVSRGAGRRVRLLPRLAARQPEAALIEQFRDWMLREASGDPQPAASDAAERRLVAGWGSRSA